MATLGFRYPQFSEDSAWLPGWFQSTRVEASYEYMKEDRTSSKDDLALQGNVVEEKVNMSSTEEDGRYNSCHLILTGEDNTSASCSQSCGNVLRFPLHLSPFSVSQDKPSPHQLQSDLNLDLAAWFVENSNRPQPEHLDVKECKSNAVSTSNLRKVEDVSTKSMKFKNSGKQYEDIFDLRCLNATGIEDAIELCVGASEALVIHEIIKEELDAKPFPLAAVLEASVQLKIARHEGLKDAFSSSINQIGEVDSLSDLDDFDMAEAYEDVGLPSSLARCHLDYGAQKAVICDISSHEESEETIVINSKLSKGTQSEIHNHEGYKKQTGTSALGSYTTIGVRHNSPSSHQSIQKKMDDLATEQRGDSAKVDVISSCPDATVNISSNVANLDRYKSRWLGGWGQKPQEIKSTRILNLFVGETSYLSESADIAPDENSAKEIHEVKSSIPSQSSKPIGVLCDVAKDGVLLSQDVIGSSNLSVVDPLCSVVPCSITSGDAASTSSPNHCQREVDIGKCHNLPADFGVENLQRTLDLTVEQIPESQEAMPIHSNENSGALFRRRLTSLKAYSMLSPDNNVESCTEVVHCNKLPLSKCTQALLSVNQSTAVGTSVHNPISGMTTNKRHYDDAVDGGEIQFESPKKSRLPFILNSRSRCRFQAPKPYVNVSKTETWHLQAAIPQPSVNHQNSNSLQNIQSQKNKPNGSCISARKRVHFADVEIQSQQKKDLKEPQSSRSTSKASKPSKQYIRWPESQIKDGKRNSRTYISKSRKRLIFRGIEFLLTGFSSEKKKEIEKLIQKYGGVVLHDIPTLSSWRRKSSKSDYQQLPVILCTKKLQTTIFLYACAVNAFLLRVEWLTDSIATGCILPSEMYTVLPDKAVTKCFKIGMPVQLSKHVYIFDSVGIMLHGKNSFCTKWEKVFKHGGGRVFKTLQGLVQTLDARRIALAAIVVEHEGNASRHLMHCALEKKIPIVSANWILESLHDRKLQPFLVENHASSSTSLKFPEMVTSIESSQEI